MPITLDVPGRDERIVEERRKWADHVIAYFDKSLPELRLLVYLDETDEMKWSIDNRGGFYPSDQEHFKGVLWSRRVHDKLRTINISASEATYHYDALIYLPNSTCEVEESVTMTLAHELQHSIQYGFNPVPWALNTLACKLPPAVINQLRLKWKDIPHERDARIVAKRACESLLGLGRTAEYIQIRKSQRLTESDVADCEYIGTIDTSKAFDWIAESKTFFCGLGGYHAELQAALDRSKVLPEFARLNLSEWIPS
jgi:hypothetical protein